MALEQLARRVARGELRLADALRPASEQSDRPAPPPRPACELRFAGADQPLRLSLSGPKRGDAVLVVETQVGRHKLDYRMVGDREIETVIPGEALNPKGETVRIWLSQGGVAAGPAVVRVVSGPLIRRAEWAALAARGARLRVIGEGFGTDPSAVFVTVGDRVWQPTNAADSQLELELAEWPSGPVWVSVEVDGRSSDPVLARDQSRAVSQEPA
jgi:hypothetical protein